MMMMTPNLNLEPEEDFKICSQVGSNVLLQKKPQDFLDNTIRFLGNTSPVLIGNFVSCATLLYNIIKRFELALHTFLAKGSHCKVEHPSHGISGSESATDIHVDSINSKGKSIIDGCTTKRLETDLGKMNIKSDLKDPSTSSVLVELADPVADFNDSVSVSNEQVQQTSYVCTPNLNPRYSGHMEGPSLGNSLPDTDVMRTSCYVDMSLGTEATAMAAPGVVLEGPSEEEP